MGYNSGDFATIDGHRFECVKVTADRKIAEQLSKALHNQGYRSRVTLRTRKHVPKEPSGSYFAGRGGYTIETFCVWQGSKRGK